MEKIVEYKNTAGQDCVSVTNQDEAIWSGLKSVWDEMQAALETPAVIDEASAE